MFDSDKIVLTKNDAFVGKSYCNQGLFMLNVYDIINNNTSSSFAYIVDSYDIWHGRPGIEKSGYIVDISEKYRISGGTETIIVTDYRSKEKPVKNRQNRQYISEISVKHR